MYVIDDKLNETPNDAFMKYFAEINRIALSSGADLEGNLYYRSHRRMPDTAVVARNEITPDFRTKRYNLSMAVTGKKLLLEVGFNAGHSALLALETNPSLTYIGVDIARHKYTRPCGDYLKSVYGDRFDVIYGSSLHVLPEFKKDSRANYVDLVHVDGGHGEQIASADLQNILALPAGQGLVRHVVVDDAGAHIRRLLISLVNSRGMLSETYGGLWRGSANMCFRLLTDKVEAE